MLHYNKCLVSISKCTLVHLSPFYIIADVFVQSLQIRTIFFPPKIHEHYLWPHTLWDRLMCLLSDILLSFANLTNHAHYAYNSCHPHPCLLIFNFELSALSEYYFTLEAVSVVFSNSGHLSFPFHRKKKMQSDTLKKLYWIDMFCKMDQRAWITQPIESLVNSAGLKMLKSSSRNTIIRQQLSLATEVEWKMQRASACATKIIYPGTSLFISSNEYFIRVNLNSRYLEEFWEIQTTRNSAKIKSSKI